ncbi:hypothetical protein M0L20_16970 [Spirosoma sp. RP8]|uniref:Uncharacterized protein n=1 Tax=Spirosoma liriopis TaxID=2937440 RepID=A0ABT0HN23_9BACT|nr:hypothetical protein [Spirosoma liriopis]MCK8493561.1 hypothetical protein [Spirosoma liriopis]
MEELKDALLKLQQMNTLRITRLEYEMLTLKNVVFKDVTDKLGIDSQEINSMFDTITRDAISGNLKNLLPLFDRLDESMIKQGLGID